MTDDDDTVLDSQEVSSVTSVDQESVSSVEGSRYQRRQRRRRKQMDNYGTDDFVAPHSNNRDRDGKSSSASKNSTENAFHLNKDSRQPSDGKMMGVHAVAPHLRRVDDGVVNDTEGSDLPKTGIHLSDDGQKELVKENGSDVVGKSHVNTQAADKPSISHQSKNQLDNHLTSQKKTGNTGGRGSRQSQNEGGRGAPKKRQHQQQRTTQPVENMAGQGINGTTTSVSPACLN